MNTIDIINKLAKSNSLTTGRSEMILSIVIERILDKLKSNGSLVIHDFGEFRIQNDGNLSGSSRQKVKFHPSEVFLEKINSV